MTLKSDAKFEENSHIVLKMTRLWWILTQTHKSLTNLHFQFKVFNVWPKKVQRSYHSWHWRVIQNLKEKWLVVSKTTWGIWQIFTRALKVSKLGLSWGPFVQSRKCMSLEFTEELCVMTMKNDAKFEEESTCHFENDMTNLTNFDSST